MSLLAWNDMFSVGVLEIDNQHKKLIEITNRLNEAMISDLDHQALSGILSDLLALLRLAVQTHHEFRPGLGQSAQSPRRSLKFWPRLPFRQGLPARGRSPPRRAKKSATRRLVLGHPSFVAGQGPTERSLRPARRG